jgi:hypothetical protein
MARSVGEAIATGLESGIGLAMRMDQNKRAIAADARAEERLKRVQAREDAAAGRQQTRDTLGALTAQRASLGAEVQAAEESGIALAPARQMAIGAATKEIDAQMNRAYADMGGADIEAVTKKYDDAIEGMKAGKFDPSALSGPEFGAVFTQATGHTPKAFMRGPASEQFPNGEPSQIEQAAMMVDQGISNGDQETALKGLNVLLKPNIDKIVGKPSAHGGVIVGAEIAGLYDDPKAPKDDPRMVPMLKIYVREDNATGPAMENGATGFYMAPVTEGRETGGNAKVKSISTTKGMDWLGKNLELVEALNTPEAAAKVQEAYATPGMTPEDWQAVKAQLGVKRPKKTTESFTLKPDEIRVEREVDASGRAVPGTERRMEGKPKPAKESAAADLLQAKLAEIEADGDMSPAEKKVARRAVLTGIKPGKYTGGAAGGPAAGGGKGGGAANAPGLTAAENRLAQRKLEDVKADITDLDKREDNAQKALDRAIANKPDFSATDEERAAHRDKVKRAEDAHAAELKKIEADRAELKKRRTRIQDQLDEVPATGQSPAPGAPAPAGKPVVTKSKADYDALPKGALYVKDGQTYRKN